ncbi:MAG: hypothetical protein HY942_07625 [Gammaproteobacteria bacterium]|nr:hypothetical protein [Gammaproteobacteria bacterium]
MKTLTGVFALMFALMLSSNVFAADAPGSAPAKADPVKACKEKCKKDDAACMKKCEPKEEKKK